MTASRITEVQTVAVALNEAAAAIRERQGLLEREKQALQEADRAKDEFIAMMSHELRNPLGVVDDNEDLRGTIAASLALQGHHVWEAADGSAALELAATAVPDVAIIDIGLPEIDGYEVARRLRGNASTRHIRLVALTGYRQSEDKRKAAEVGFDEHLTKPVDPAVLSARSLSPVVTFRNPVHDGFVHIVMKQEVSGT